MAADDGGVVEALARVEGKLDLLISTVLTRLLDAVVPTAEQMAAREGGGEGTGARDVDDVEDVAGWAASVQDWTDPFIGLEQPRLPNQVARLEPGEQIPYVPTPEGAGDGVPIDRWRESGAAAFDEWNRETHLPDVGGEMVVGRSWVEPLEL